MQTRELVWKLTKPTFAGDYQSSAPPLNRIHIFKSSRATVKNEGKTAGIRGENWKNWQAEDGEFLSRSIFPSFHYRPDAKIDYRFLFFLFIFLFLLPPSLSYSYPIFEYNKNKKPLIFTKFFQDLRH